MSLATTEATVTLYALGFSFRKRSLVRQFLNCPSIRFVRHDRHIPDGATVAVWASGPYGIRWTPIGGTQRFRRIFLEDGFLRSVGLGADLVRPLSWVVDERGIYYDASQPSDLEHHLQHTVFERETLQRAAILRRRLVANQLTKYNVGAVQWHRSEKATGKHVVLAVGQVETDAALAFGAPGIKTNLALVQAARLAHPNAWLIYKPHPDVVAGLRNSGQNEADASKWCDEVVTETSMANMLDKVDVVHVLSSLAGFEALLRGKDVICHGLPFYAGWGLTQDVLTLARRQRQLSVDELVAGTLLHYPRYVSRSTGARCSAEKALDDLIEWKAASDAGISPWRKILRIFIRRP